MIRSRMLQKYCRSHKDPEQNAGILAAKEVQCKGMSMPSPKGKDSEEESGDEMKNLLHERDDVEERLAEMQRKMEGLEWSEKARQYRTSY